MDMFAHEAPNVVTIPLFLLMVIGFFGIVGLLAMSKVGYAAIGPTPEKRRKRLGVLITMISVGAVSGAIFYYLAQSMLDNSLEIMRNDVGITVEKDVVIKFIALEQGESATFSGVKDGENGEFVVLRDEENGELFNFYVQGQSDNLIPIK